MRLVLASTSPRRAMLLRAAGYDFDVRPSGADEWPYAGGDPGRYTESLAEAKAVEGGGDEVVVGADTVVVLDGTVLGKPVDADDAAGMLRRLSGRTHEVITGVAVRHAARVRSGHARTRLTLRPLEEREIHAYVATGEPLDKAGAYAAQGVGGLFIDSIHGSYTNVVGLPLALLFQMLRKAGIDPLQ